MTDPLLAKVQAALAAVEHRPECARRFGKYNLSTHETRGWYFLSCTCDWQARVAQGIRAAIEKAVAYTYTATHCLRCGAHLTGTGCPNCETPIGDAAVAAFQERAK